MRRKRDVSGQGRRPPAAGRWQVAAGVWLLLLLQLGKYANVPVCLPRGTPLLLPGGEGEGNQADAREGDGRRGAGTWHEIMERVREAG